MPPMSDRALPPVPVPNSDGQPTDDFTGGLATLMQEPRGALIVVPASRFRGVRNQGFQP
jgi:hypothetical protein